MRLAKGDGVVAAEVAEPGADLLIVTEHGFGKRTGISEFEPRGRGGSGVRAIGLSARNGQIAAARVVRPIDEVMVISADGLALRTLVDGISKTGRSAHGVILMNLDPADRVAAVAVINGDGRGNGQSNGNGHGNGRGTGRARSAKALTDGSAPTSEVEGETLSLFGAEDAPGGLANGHVHDDSDSDSSIEESEE